MFFPAAQSQTISMHAGVKLYVVTDIYDFNEFNQVNMAVTPIRYKIPYIGRPHLTQNIPRQYEGLVVCDHGSPVDGLRWFCSGSVDITRRW